MRWRSCRARACSKLGCGSGVIMRELAQRTAGANRLIGRDMIPNLPREARALARREGLSRPHRFWRRPRRDACWQNS